jgi:hypothetical protein
MRGILALLAVLLLWSTASQASVNRICGRDFAVTEGGRTLNLRYCGNVDLVTPDPKVTIFVITIHGTSRTAYNYWKNMESAAVSAGVGNSTAVIAPQFLRTLDDGQPVFNATGGATQRTLDLAVADANVLYWGSTWLDGENSFVSASSPSRPFRVSSFDVLDRILAQAAVVYPNLKRVVIVGHSAGGQMVNRYATVAALPVIPGAKFIFGPTNPSSNLYWDDKRPVQPISGPVSFAVPDRTWCPEDPGSLSSVDRYKFGTGPYPGVDFNNHLLAVGLDAMRKNYNDRTIIHFIGLDDNDPDEESLGKSCPNRVQGLHRLERAEAYLEHIRNYFGWRKFATTRPIYAPGCAHSGNCIWSSPCGLYEIFGTVHANICANPWALTDRFETNFAQWTSSGKGTFFLTSRRRAEGAYAAEFRGVMTDLKLTSPVVSGAGTYTASWAWWIGSRFDRGDSIVAQMSVDGGAWADIDRLEGNVHPENEWIYTGITVKAAKSLQFRFVVNADDVDEEAHLDDFRVVHRKGL